MNPVDRLTLKFVTQDLTSRAQDFSEVSKKLIYQTLALAISKPKSEENYGLKKYKSFIASLWLALEKDPCKQNLDRLMLNLVKSENTDLLACYLGKISKSLPQLQPHALFWYGLLAFRQNDNTLAAQFFYTHLQSYPCDYDAAFYFQLISREELTMIQDGPLKVVLKAHTFYVKGSYEEALKLTEKCDWFVCLLFFRLDRTVQALKIADVLFDLNANIPLIFIYDIYQYLAESSISHKVNEYLCHNLEKTPYSYGDLLLLAQLMYRVRKEEGALETLSKISCLYESSEISILKAKCYLRLKDFSNVEKELKKIPISKERHRIEGDLRFVQSDFKAAEIAFKKCEFFSGLAYIIYLTDKKRVLEAKDLLYRSIRQNKNLAEAWSGLAGIEFDSGNYEDAENFYLKSLLIDTYNDFSCRRVAECLMMQKEYDKALEYINKALTIQPNRQKHRLTQIKILFFLHEYKKGIQEGEYLLKEYPEDHYPRSLIAKGYYELHDYSKALRQLNIYLREFPHDQDSIILKGLTLGHLKNYKESAAILEPFEDIEHSEFLLIKGRNLSQLGRHALAVDIFASTPLDHFSKNYLIDYLSSLNALGLYESCRDVYENIEISSSLIVECAAIAYYNLRDWKTALNLFLSLDSPTYDNHIQECKAALKSKPAVPKRVEVVKVEKPVIEPQSPVMPVDHISFLAQLRNAFLPLMEPGAGFHDLAYKFIMFAELYNRPQHAEYLASHLIRPGRIKEVKEQLIYHTYYVDPQKFQSLIHYLCEHFFPSLSMLCKGIEISCRAPQDYSITDPHSFVDSANNKNWRREISLRILSIQKHGIVSSPQDITPSLKFCLLIISKRLFQLEHLNSAKAYLELMPIFNEKGSPRSFEKITPEEQYAFVSGIDELVLRMRKAALLTD